MVGAGVGVLGSLLTGTFTWVALRSQQRTELLRQEQATRRETYVNLLNSVRTARGSLATALDGLAVGEQGLGGAWGSLAAVDSATAAVQLEGPQEIAAKAADLAEALFAVFRAAYPWRVDAALDDPHRIAAYREAWSALDRAEQAFLSSARQASFGPRA